VEKDVTVSNGMLTLATWTDLIMDILFSLC